MRVCTHVHLHVLIYRKYDGLWKICLPPFTPMYNKFSAPELLDVSKQGVQYKSDVYSFGLLICFIHYDIEESQLDGFLTCARFDQLHNFYEPPFRAFPAWKEVTQRMVNPKYMDRPLMKEIVSLVGKIEK